MSAAAIKMVVDAVLCVIAFIAGYVIVDRITGGGK